MRLKNLLIISLLTVGACNGFSAHKSIAYGNGHDPQRALIVEGRYYEVRLKQPHVDVGRLCIETDYMHSAYCYSPKQWIEQIQKVAICKEK